MEKFISGILVLSVLVVFIYGGYWIAKTVSYSLFYESMVEQTVKELVKKEALK